MTPRSCRYHFNARRSRSGFALIITIILMAFLVLLMVSMATLTRVETQVAANYQQQDQARSNALLALNLALGQLQAAAGPDQRITARAEILDDSPTNEAVTGVNQPHWTGVWKTGRASPDITGNSQTAQRETTFGSLTPTFTEKVSSATAWLVSNPPSSPRVDPIANTFTIAETLTGADIIAAAQSGVTTAASGAVPTAVLLAKNLGRNDSSIPYDAATNVGYVVAAPLVDLTAPVAALGNASAPIGRYAYWVSDEGIKARVNIKDPTLKTDHTGATQVDAETHLATNQLHFVGPQAIAAHEILPSTLATDFRGAADYRQNPKVDQVLTPQQLPLLPSIAPTDYVSNNYLADITTYSYGVLADVRNGGLRKDLTAAFEDDGGNANKNYAKLNPYSSGQKYTERVYDIFKDTVPLATTTTTTFAGVGSINIDLKGLLWGDLHRFYNYYKSTQPTLANLAAPNAGAKRPTGVGSPAATRPYVVSQASFSNYELNNTASSSTYSTGQMSPICIGLRFDVALKSKEVSAGNFKLYLEYHPVSIWYNPYSVSITSNLEDQTIQVIPEVDTYLKVAYGANEHFCMLNQANPSNGRVSFTNNPNDTQVFEPGAIRVFAMSVKNNEIAPTTTAYSYGHTSSSMFKASNFGRSWGQPLPSLVSKGAAFSYSNETEFVAVSSIDTLKTANYTTIASLPTSTDITFSLGTINRSYYQLQKTADILRWSMGSWPNNSSSTDWTSSFGFTAGVNGVGANFLTNPQPTKTRKIESLKDVPVLLCSFNMRVKGLKSFATPLFANSASQIPSFMGNSEVFNPISTTFSGCWNETAVPSLGASWPPDYSIPSDIKVGIDTYGFTFSTWGDESAGEEAASTGGSYRKVLADIPLQPMISLGQFMHLQSNYYLYYDSYARMTFGSMFVGGSYPNPGVPLNQNLKDVTGTPSEMQKLMREYKLYSLDNSYLANQALFDSYYFSTVPPTLPTTVDSSNPALPPIPQVYPTQWTAFNDDNNGTRLENARTPFLNSRMVPYRKNGEAPLLADLRDMDKAAANLLLLGAFNINSTSVDAWRALLSSLSGNDLSVWNASERRTVTFTATDLKNPIPRFWSATGNANLDTPWCGVRTLTDDQITELARRIVREVKARGPFLSLADFLNRRLGTSSTDLTRAGALQAAIDKTSLNDAFKGALYPDVNVTAAISGTTQLPSVLPIEANMKDASSPVGQPWKTTVGMPGYLMQQDLVQAFSPVMTARSDTFVIRTYGEKTDPLTQKTVAKAYCEAVVQRLPDYVDQSDQALTNTQTGYLAAAGDATPVYQANGVTRIVNSTNETFGRRFKIVSFRWITPNDL